MELETFLGDFGLDVVGTADNGLRAVDLAARHRPDLIMMDVVIKGSMDGIEAARRIRATLDVPVIFLTAYGDEATLERAKSTAPYGYLLKPYRPDALRAAVTVGLYKHRLELQLKASEQWFAKTLHCLTDGVIATDPQSNVKFMNPVAEALTGFDAARAMGRALSEVVSLIDEDSKQPLVPTLGEAFDMGAAVTPRGAVLRREGRADVSIDESAAPIRDDDDRVLGGVVVLRDVSERKRMEEALLSSEERFHSAFDQAAIGMALVSTAGEILQANRAMASMLGYEEAGLRGRTLSSLSHPEHVDVERPILAVLDAEERPAIQLEKLFLHREGHSLWMHMNASVVRDLRRNPVCFIVQMQDITARKAAEGRLEYLAHFDTLTGLRNRGSFQLQLSAAIAAAHRTHGTFAVLFLDLDGFKHVNDSLGHHVGDALLQEVGTRLRSAVRGNDVIGRTGGDEFVVLAEGVGADSVGGVARKLLDAVSRPYQVEGREVSLTGSIGVSFFPSDGDNVDELLRNADSAMYRAKDLGRNQFALYDVDLTRRAFERLHLESALRQALGRGEFLLYYQPIVADGRPRSMEALLRWQHRERGLVRPELFIGLVEEMGLLPDIGDWVVVAACRQLRSWRDTGFELESVAVNVSFSQLARRGFVELVDRALVESRLEGRDLEVEITETSAMRDPETTVRTLRALRERGVLVSIDDFGTGFSSLAHLSRLPVNRLKIDRSFVHLLPRDENAAAVVTSIAALGHALGLAIVAEGVESAEQETFLLAQHVGELQGFRFARPMPPLEASAYLGPRPKG